VLLCDLCNVSLAAGVLPASQIHAIVRPLQKKPTLDVHYLSSYRPVSNLSFVSKTVERVVAAGLLHHVTLINYSMTDILLYRRFHSTETALSVVHNDLVIAADVDLVSALVLHAGPHQCLRHRRPPDPDVGAAVKNWRRRRGAAQLNSYVFERSRSFSASARPTTGRSVAAYTPGLRVRTPGIHQLHGRRDRLPVHHRVQFKLYIPSTPDGVLSTTPTWFKAPLLTNVEMDFVRETTEYRLLKSHSALGEPALSFAGPLAWNKLPPALHDITN